VVRREIDNYEVGHMLGKGCYGHVRIAKKKGHNKFMYAIKYMKIDNDKAKHYHDYILKQENNIKNLDHENILKIYETSLNGTYKKIKTIGVDVIPVAYIVLQLAPNGDLFDFIIATGGLSEEIAGWYFHRIINVMHYLHSQGIAHRDIKLENILLDENYNPLISDFGLSQKLEEVGFMTNESIHRVGTERCMSPELLEYKEHNPIKDDIFALGYLLFMMVAKHQPFQRASADNPYYSRIKNNEVLEYWKLVGELHSPMWCTPMFMHLMTSLMSYEMAIRPSLAEIKGHPWMKSKEDIKFDSVSKRCKDSLNAALEAQENAARERMKFNLKRKKPVRKNNNVPEGYVFNITKLDKGKDTHKDSALKEEKKYSEKEKVQDILGFDREAIAELDAKNKKIPFKVVRHVIPQVTKKKEHAINKKNLVFPMKLPEMRSKKATRNKMLSTRTATIKDTFDKLTITQMPPSKEKEALKPLAKSKAHKKELIIEEKKDNVIPTAFDGVEYHKQTMILSQEDIKSIELELNKFFSSKKKATNLNEVKKKSKAKKQFDIHDIQRNTKKHKVVSFFTLVFN